MDYNNKAPSSDMIPIDRTEIETWGKKFDAKGNFPKLIAKLVRETTPKSTVLHMPSGSAVNMGGWDGVVSCQETTGYVPQGVSLWEIGANGGTTKANKDYKNRTAESLSFDKSKATFVFVTTLVWEGKDDWVKARKEEGVWGNVLAYNSNDIAEWLENAQVSCRWFSILTQNHPYDGIYTAEEYWKMLSIGPNGQLPPKIVTAGREHQSTELLEFLSGKPALKAVKGSTKEEAIAFIIASAMQYDNHQKGLFFSRSVVVDNEHNFHGLRINKNAINLIAKLDLAGNLYVAAHDNGHHVMVPLGPDDNFGSKDIIELPRIDRDGQIEALQEMGLTREEAQSYSKEAGRDYTILKSLLGFMPDEKKWKYQDKISEIIPTLLMGRWDESKEGDKEILQTLAGEDYNTYSEKLYKWLDVDSPPLIKIGHTWRLTSPLDAWTHLSDYLSVKDFGRLKECFLLVMKEVNPVLEVKPELKLLVSTKGRESQYSSWCREGLTQSMILISLHGDKFKFQHDFSSQSWVDGIIKELLYDAPGDVWISRDSQIPLIAEASPKSFLEAAYHSLSLDDKPIMEMFVEEDGFLTPFSHHTGLLWALEGLAWTEEYVYDSAILLAKLAALDPGGNLTNRPMNSLCEIFKPWHYQTLASFEDRMQILEEIISREYSVGWQVLYRMIPDGPGGSAFPTQKMRWRLFERSFKQEYTWQEIFDTHSRVMKLLVEHFDFSESKLVDLLKKSESNQLRPSDRDKVLSYIEDNLDKIQIKNNSAWHELRDTLSQHRTHQDAKWALPEEALEKYEQLYRKLTPLDQIDNVIWMFDEHWPKFSEGAMGREIRDQEKFINQKRVEGLEAIYQTHGLDKLYELVTIVKQPWIYGDALAQVVNNEDEVFRLCEYLESSEDSHLNFIGRFIYRKSIINTIDWVFELFEKLKKQKYSDKALARVFYQVEQSKKVWEFIEHTNEATQHDYWTGIYPHFWGLPKEEIVYGLDRLMWVKRFISALDIVYHKPEVIPTEKMVEVLETAGTQKSEENNRFDSYHVARIIEVLELRSDIEKAIMLRIEWLYLPFLASYSSGYKPKLLHKELAVNPVFFNEVLEAVYKSENDKDEQEIIVDEATASRSRNAYDLLRSWKLIPGVDENGVIDNEFLWNWIKKVRSMAEKSGRLKVADMEIGQVLAQYPEEKEPWPPHEICNVIDSINTQNIKSGFSSATFNKRGSSTRGPFDGGAIERRHAKYFRQQAGQLKFKFPETAGVLTQLAEGYEKDAKRMDDMAERDKLDN